MNINEILNTYDSRINFMKGIVSLAKVDGLIDADEHNFFINAMTTLNISSEDINELSKALTDKNIDKEIKFDNKKQSLFFLKEAIQLCYCNNVYSVEEQELIKEFANKLNLSEETLKVIENWALEGFMWAKKGEELLELEV